LGYEVSDGKVTGEGIEVGGDAGAVGSLVALAVPTGNIFDLWRFKDSGSSFSRLIDYLGIKVEDRLDALFVLDDYFVFANGLRTPSDEIVWNDFDLRIKALRYFRSEKPKKAYREFLRWWNNVSPEWRKIREPETAIVKDGFLITLFRFSEGRVYKEQWKVSSTGAVTRVSSKSLCCGSKS